MSFLSDAVNVFSGGLVGDGPLSRSPQQIAPSESFSYSSGTLSPSTSTQNQSSYGINSSGQSLFGPQAQSLSPLFNFAGGLLNQYKGDPSQLIPGFSQYEQQGQQQIANVAPQLQDIFNSSQQGLNQALNTDVTANPFFQSAVQASLNPFIRSFQQSILPGIHSQAVGVGQPGGSREQIAQGIATQGLGQQLSDIVAQMGLGAYGQGLQSRQGALGLAPQIAQLGLAPGNALLGIGGQQRQLEQQQRMAPFTLGQGVQGLLGSPITLAQSMGLTGSSGSQRSTGAITGPSYSSSTGAIEDLGMKGPFDRLNLSLPVPV